VQGAVHHVIQRGMDRTKIFRDDDDMHLFEKRMGKNFIETGTKCYAWSLMPNHIHLVLSTGEDPIRHALQCIFTGYAMGYNRKYGRTGHVFEHRYQSILCEKETYLLELVRYVHLNPVKAEIVGSVEELSGYRWTGHMAMMGKAVKPWQDTESILGMFGSREGPARNSYLKFVRGGLKSTFVEQELMGKGMKRLSEGGWEGDHRKPSESDSYADERIVGSREFVNRVLKEAGERERWRSKMAGKWTPEKVIERAAKVAGIKVVELKGSGKRPAQCKARLLACKWLVLDLGISETLVAGLLGITQPAVSKAVIRGKAAEGTRGIHLEGLSGLSK